MKISFILLLALCGCAMVAAQQQQYTQTAQDTPFVPTLPQIQQEMGKLIEYRNKVHELKIKVQRGERGSPSEPLPTLAQIAAEEKNIAEYDQILKQLQEQVQSGALRPSTPFDTQAVRTLYMEEALSPDDLWATQIPQQMAPTFPQQREQFGQFPQQQQRPFFPRDPMEVRLQDIERRLRQAILQRHQALRTRRVEEIRQLDRVIDNLRRQQLRLRQRVAVTPTRPIQRPGRFGSPVFPETELIDRISPVEQQVAAFPEQQMTQLVDVDLIDPTTGLRIDPATLTVEEVQQLQDSIQSMPLDETNIVDPDLVESGVTDFETNQWGGRWGGGGWGGRWGGHGGWGGGWPGRWGGGWGGWGFPGGWGGGWGGWGHRGWGGWGRRW